MAININNTVKVIVRNRYNQSFLLLLAGLSMISLVGCSTKIDKAMSSATTKLESEAAADDFAFPSRPPKLSEGKKVFNEQCKAYPPKFINYQTIKAVKPIDMYLDLVHGQSCTKNMTRDQRWAVVFYIRYLAGETSIQNPTVAAIFGANCAVCHGSKGQGDGPLYTGHASAHELGMAPRKMAFYPPPANFTDYGRMYNRTNDWLTKVLTEGVYPSAMPSWKGRVDKDKGFVFDDAMLLDLVKYVRSLSFENDLPDAEKKGPIQGQSLQLQLTSHQNASS